MSTMQPEARGAEHVSFEFELLRKSIHMMSLSIPVVYYFVTRDVMLMLLIPLTLLFVVGDVMRSFHEPTFRLYEKIFGRMLRPHEKTKKKKTLNGASWVLISAILTVLIFPKLIAITAFAILIVSDTIAALIGRRFGTRKFNDKSLEGSTAFVLSAIIVILFTPKIVHAPAEYVIAIVAAVIGAISEVLSFDIIDDNFAIPLSIGSAMWLLYFLFLPELNVYCLDG